MKCMNLDFHEDTSTCLDVRWAIKEKCGQIITDGEYCFYYDDKEGCINADLFT